MKTIGFIGCGNIASAIASGAVSSGYLQAAQVYGFDIDPQKLKAAVARGMQAAADAQALAGSVDYLFLTVKPQVMERVVSGIRGLLGKNTVVVTPAAGVTIQKMQSFFHAACPVIRVMPNTPLMYGAGATAMVQGDGVSDADFAFVKGIFDACGVTAVVEESAMDIVTGISGSSPAFFMRFAREIVREGVRQGMTVGQAETLVYQTMAGSAKILMESGKTADELIAAVASPNGTTEAGLKTMDVCGFDDMAAEVTGAAIARSRELSK